MAGQHGSKTNTCMPLSEYTTCCLLQPPGKENAMAMTYRGRKVPYRGRKALNLFAFQRMLIWKGDLLIGQPHTRSFLNVRLAMSYMHRRKKRKVVAV